jgi:signal peptidase I
MYMGAVKAGSAKIQNLGSESAELRQFVFGTRPQKTFLRVLLWSVLSVAFFHHLLVPIQIIGSSMSPTYSNGSLNLVNRWSYAGRAPHRGDVIAVRADGELLLKRIIAVPGETVAIVNGELEVNGKPLADEFSGLKIPWEMDPMRLGMNEFFVIGDNRPASVFCKVRKTDILGKTVF